MFFHFSVPGLGGGFVGVDVFFVISGFLIGGILWQELAQTGRLSLSHFYLRRFRRLAPAFAVMAVVTAAAAALILLPFEFRAFGKSLIAATVYLANVQFWREAGYFDTEADSKILLHTWSLSVEEQFYLAVPILMLVLRNRPALLRGVLWLTFAASLIACVAMTPRWPSATFFLFPFRAWELLTGVLLAVEGQRRGWRWSVHPALSWAGIALLAGSITLVRAGDSFPGIQALLPVLGTALLIANGRQDNPVNRALAARGPVFVGLISYSLYLWHWPVFTLSQYYREEYSGAAEAAAWMALATLLAVLSWRYVELPFRHGLRINFPVALAGVGAASAVLLAIGAAAYLTDGAPARFRPETRVHIAASADFLQDTSRCARRETGPFAGLEICEIGPEGAAPRVLIWGDSHLRAFMEGLALAAQETATPGMLIWNAGCPPVFGVTKVETATTPAEDRACTSANATMLAALPELAGIERVLLIGRWSYYATGTGTGRDAENRIEITPQPGSGLEGAVGQAALMDAALRATVDTLRRYFTAVYVLRQVPEMPFYDSRTIARRLARGDASAETEAALSVPQATVLDRVASAEVPLIGMDLERKITLIDSWTELCDADRCGVMQAGQALYFDNNHLTNTGARALRHLFVPFLSAGGVPHTEAIAAP